MKKIVIMVFVLMISCKKETYKISREKEAHSIETVFFKNMIDKMDMSPSYDWVVVLPELGCHGCIKQGESFMQEHINKKNILFVLTKIESLKILQKKIKIKIKEHSNIYIDRRSEFNSRTDNEIYPCIIQLENGKFKKHEFQSPKNGSAFRKLKKKINV